MTREHFLSSIAVERQQRLEGRERPDPRAFSLWNEALALPGGDEFSARLRSAYDFARSLQYAHEGLSGDIYIAHPIRVAAMALLSQPVPDADLGVLGLLHNTLEVSDISREALARQCGASISDQIASLTVDRKQQWDPQYKSAYYGELNSGPRAARVIKVLDKLDNLFLLGLNPDATIRERYLLEVEAYVLPMAQRELPALYEYMTDLVRDCRATGYFGSA